MWGIPGSARASALIAEAQPARRRRHDGLAGSHEPAAPRGQGRRTLTDDERKTIAVYPMDLGGQYCARQNTGFVPFTSGDPVTPAPRFS